MCEGLLKDKVAIVTGAAKGIGQSTVRAFFRESCHVVLVDIDGDAAQEVADACMTQFPGSKAVVVQANVTNKSDALRVVEKTLETFNRIDILVNVAGGFSKECSTLELKEEEWDNVIDLNLKSMFLYSQAVMPSMISQNYGRIINVSSFSGRSGRFLTCSPYAAAKAGAIGFTMHLSNELGKFGIAVNAVAPGPTNSPRFLRVRSPEVVAKFLEQLPVGRLSEPEEQAEAILFLASDRASYITGAVLDVNGGLG